jgi:hypothetical protein
MKMTRTHFQHLADLCAETIEICDCQIGYSEREAIIKKFVKLCAKSNAGFREDIFRDWVTKFSGEKV